MSAATNSGKSTLAALMHSCCNFSRTILPLLTVAQGEVVSLPFALTLREGGGPPRSLVFPAWCHPEGSRAQWRPRPLPSSRRAPQVQCAPEMSSVRALPARGLSETPYACPV
jgi:hypothetical protein